MTQMQTLETNRDQGHAALAEALQVSFRVLRVVMILLLVAYALSGIFVVRQDEKAFVLVFGKISGLGTDRVKGPGLHWTFPRPIGEIVRVKTEQIQSVESLTFAPATADNAKVLYSLTGDANLMNSRWVVRYQVDDPAAYLFGFEDESTILRRELDHAVVNASGRFAIDRALRTDIEAFRSAVANEMTRRCQELALGVKIVGVEVLAVAPPKPVADAFNDVIAAEQDRSEKISASRGVAARTVNEAAGQAAKLITEGQSYQRRLVSEVSADADYFTKVYEQFVKNTDVVTRTLWQDAIRRTLANAENKFVLPEAGAGKQELRLQLNREPKAFALPGTEPKAKSP